MLDLLVLSLTAWFKTFQRDLHFQPIELFAWEKSAIFQLPLPSNDRQSESLVGAYLQNLATRGINPKLQGIWMQSDWGTPITHQAKVPLPAASLTKIATTLASLNKWGVEHQFMTNIYLTGEIANGVVTGDLIVKGSGDPFFVWEEAISLGNALNQLGIHTVRGNLAIVDKFYMNYQSESLTAGKLLKQGLNRELWQSEVTQQYLQMPAGTAQPQVTIPQEVKLSNRVPSNAQLLIAHQSLPLAEILRQMNIYSNNKMAQMLADLAGGVDSVARISPEIAKFDPREIQLVNGSGLGEDNRISPHAVVKMLMAIDRLLQSHSLNTADLFPTAGRDLVGTVRDRSLPKGTTIKTGTLNNVSALAGVIPTNERGNVYFSIINYGSQVEYFRQQQDLLLNELVQPWQLIPNTLDLASQNNWYLGDPQRNSFPLKPLFIQ